MSQATMEVEWIEREYPQLTQKAVVDFVNGLQVIDHQLQFRSTKNGILERLWGGFTGETARRQQLIDEHSATALQTVRLWLLRHEQVIANSDLMLQSLGRNLGDVARSLLHTQDEVLGLNARVKEGFSVLSRDLARVAEQAGQRMAQLEARTARLEASEAARTQMDLVISRWEGDHWRFHTPEQRLFLACNELYWGGFGTWLRVTADDPAYREKEVRPRLAMFRNHAMRLLERGYSRRGQPFARQALGERLRCANDLGREALEYLGGGYDVVVAPLPAWIGSLNGRAPAQPALDRLDHLYSYERLVDIMLEQALDGGAI